MFRNIKKGGVLLRINDKEKNAYDASRDPKARSKILAKKGVSSLCARPLDNKSLKWANNLSPMTEV